MVWLNRDVCTDHFHVGIFIRTEIADLILKAYFRFGSI